MLHQDAAVGVDGTYFAREESSASLTFPYAHYALGPPFSALQRLFLPNYCIYSSFKGFLRTFWPVTCENVLQAVGIAVGMMEVSRACC